MSETSSAGAGSGQPRITYLTGRAHGESPRRLRRHARSAGNPCRRLGRERPSSTKGGRSAPRSAAARQRVNRPGRSRGAQKRLRRAHAPVCRLGPLPRVAREAREHRRWRTRGCPRARGHLASTPTMAFRHRPNGAREGFSSRHAPAPRRLRTSARGSPSAHRHAHLRRLRGEVLPVRPLHLVRARPPVHQRGHHTSVRTRRGRRPGPRAPSLHARRLEPLHCLVMRCCWRLREPRWRSSARGCWNRSAVDSVATRRRRRRRSRAVAQALCVRLPPR